MDKEYEESVQDFLGQFPEPDMEPEDRAPPPKKPRLVNGDGAPIPPGSLHFDTLDGGYLQDARIYDMRADQGQEIVWNPRPFDDGISVTLDNAVINTDLLNDIIWGASTTTTNAGPICGVAGATAYTGGYTLSDISDAIARVTQRLNQQYTTTNFNTP